MVKPFVFAIYHLIDRIYTYEYRLQPRGDGGQLARRPTHSAAAHESAERTPRPRNAVPASAGQAMATPGMPGGAPPGAPPARPWERAQPGAAQGGAPAADPQVGVPQAQPGTPPPQPARPWERAPSGGVPAGATQAQAPQPPAGMPQAQPGTPPPQPARPWERAPSAGVPGDVPAQPGTPPPGAPPQPGMPSAAQQPPQSPPTAAPPARPWERGAGWQSQPSAGWGAPTSQPRPRMPPVDVDAFLAGLQQEPPVSSTPASASAAPAPGATPSPAPSPAPTSATAPQPRTAPSPMPAAAPVPPPVPGSSSAPRPSYSDFVSSIPTALHETGAIAYSGPPASTSRNPPQHGDGSASPWVAAHRRGFCEIEVFEDLPYGRVLGSVRSLEPMQNALYPWKLTTPEIMPHVTLTHDACSVCCLWSVGSSGIAL